ncbi:DNA polymerase III subunit gamma/tau [Aquincola sp. S2]|uniref:DNA polymerase III subunit gamma/tau n=1 Tax=Pseudaquabacterium terrae TaxID=2732868 RepID=A0ABX2EMS4_9BURK|nr:DNA polymerase III subunit gamma/tau [Aquabacterium terrae]NRF69935.1 DNA polymerase III subunit gamma/tau [Aquabacterium terrae]
MSHVVLARKYRPRSFEQMVGQEHVVQALGNALATGRLHHAYLFTGTRGIGKTTVSRILAKSLNCTGPDGSGGVTAQPCGQCQACTEIDADRYIDYIELDAASNRSIDEIRDLIERAAYKPSVGRFKVFMIDEAHQLTKDAFNALLKTLEEPPDYLKFVLATTDPEKMLPTVLSRCLQFNLRPMAPEVVHGHLQAVLEAEGVPSDAGALRLLSRAARGSMRDALSLTDQAIAYGGGRLDESGVRVMLGSVDRRHAAQLVEALAARDGAAMLATVDALRQHGLSAAGTLEEMAALLQQMAIEQAVPGALDDNDPDTAAARALAATLPADETQLLYSIVVHGRVELSLLSDDYAALTMVLLRLLAFPPSGPAPAPMPGRAVPLQAAPREARLSTTPKPLPAAPARPQPKVAAPPPAIVARPPAPAAASVEAAAEPPPWVDEPLPDDAADAGPAESRNTAPTPTPAAAPTALRTTALGDRWAAALRPLIADGAITALVRELALQAELVGLDTVDAVATWRLRVERETLRTPALRDKLQAALQAALGSALQLQLESGIAEDSIARRDAAAREAAQREAEHMIRDDPAVRALMAQFRTARIVPGTIKPLPPLAG